MARETRDIPGATSESYETPAIRSYSLDRLLAELGPARASYGQGPPCGHPPCGNGGGNGPPCNPPCGN